MQPKTEFLYYVTVGAGLAFSNSTFLLISGLFQVADLAGILMGILAGALLCGCIASAVAELASIYPSSPGIRTYLKASFGDRISLSLVFAYLAMVVLVAGAESHVFALIVQALAPGLPPLAVVLAVLCAIILVNLLGYEFPLWFQIISTVLLLGSALAVGVNGIARHREAIPSLLGRGSPVRDGMRTLPEASGMAIFLFIGFEWVTPLGLSKGSYVRKIPRSMPAAIWSNAVVCLALATGMAATLGPAKAGGSPIPHLAYVLNLYGGKAAWFAGVLSLLAIATTFNAGLMGGARFMYALAREGKLPKVCARISLNSGAPVGSILALGALSLGAALLTNFFGIDLVFAIVSSALICFVYGGLVLAVPRLRKAQPGKDRPFATSIPMWLLWILGLALPCFGLASLLSIRQSAVWALSLTASIIAASWLGSGKATARPAPSGAKRQITTEVER